MRAPVLALALLTATLGCFGAAVPHLAHKGSTVAIAVAGESQEGTAVGYGGSVYDASGLIDYQRGRLEFSFHDDTTGDQVGPSVDPIIVTRVRADPASDHALDSAEITSLLGGQGQVLALLEIPDVSGLPADRYVLRATHVTGESDFALRSPLGPQPLYETDIEILDPPTSPNPLTGFSKNLATGAKQLRDLVLQGDFERLFPHPKQLVVFSAQPAAAHLELSYDTNIISQILTVDVEQNGESDGFVVWSEPTPGELEVELVSPRQTVLAVAIVFQLRDGAVIGPAVPPGVPGTTPTFQIDAQEFFDLDGASTTATATLGVIR